MDWDSIITNVAIGIVSGAAGWAVQSITKLRRDVNYAFRKIRSLEGEVNGESTSGNRDGDTEKTAN